MCRRIIFPTIILPVVKWRSVAHLLFANWLNYYVYQETPYEIDSIG